MRQHRNWQRVLFCDESRFQLFTVDGKTRIYQRAGERTALCCVQETVPFGGGSVMVWGDICGQINILSKYNICINLCFVLFFIF